MGFRLLGNSPSFKLDSIFYHDEKLPLPIYRLSELFIGLTLHGVIDYIISLKLGPGVVVYNLYLVCNNNPDRATN